MTPFHSKYWAHILTLKSASCSIQNLSRSIANACVDLNPHQVNAALFALQSPLSKGVVLADEVGLGKTIEAGLVVAQYWAERKRKILLIVPAFLRKQWQQELRDKFFIPSLVLDSKAFREHQKNGEKNPFNNESQIIICSYHFASRQEHFIKDVSWDLVVIDEAHRLRNVYKNSNVRAKAISESLKDCKKILLTATPLQNNLMELFGLVSVIDPHVFPDEGAFKEQFVKSKDSGFCMGKLKERTSPIITRTLRKQVREYIPFTNRVAITQRYFPTDDEQNLYEGISTYLQKDHLYAIPNQSQRSLITLILRKLLASSSFAIAQTLKTLISRLERQSESNDILGKEEQEYLDSISEERKEEEYLPNEDEAYNSFSSENEEGVLLELKELRSYLAIAESIQKNKKGEALLIALENAFRRLKELGAQQKAVIFTESKRTQAYLFELLTDNGYANNIVLLNGSNNDPTSKQIYQKWLEKHDGESIISGSKQVDLKSALIEKFKNDSRILIATEAAAEGVNLQFCSLVVNYDLPWNPQRVEQRIGRCHRYGQKHDVVVVNFLNERNAVDQRVYDLLQSKFQLFDGVFGASDEVLGVIESGVDIERRICEVYQTCRSPEDIQKAFDQLQIDLDDQIKLRLLQTKEHLFQHFDEDVTSLLKIRQSETESSLNNREKYLWNLTKQELPESTFHEKSSSFVYHSQGRPLKYFLRWKIAESENGIFYREEHPLAINLISNAKSRVLTPSHLKFNYSANISKISVLESLVGKSGWLELSLLKLDTFDTEEFFIFSAMTDEGDSLDSEICSKLFQVPAQILQSIDESSIPDLTSLKQNSQSQIFKEVEGKNRSFFEQEEQKLDDWSEDLKLGLEKELRDLDKEIREFRKNARFSETLAEKLTFQRKIKALEKKRNLKRSNLYKSQDHIENKRDELISNLEKQMKPKSSAESLFVIRWSVA